MPSSCPETAENQQIQPIRPDTVLVDATRHVFRIVNRYAMLQIRHAISATEGELPVEVDPQRATRRHRAIPCGEHAVDSLDHCLPQHSNHFRYSPDYVIQPAHPVRQPGRPGWSPLPGSVLYPQNSTAIVARRASRLPHPRLSLFPTLTLLSIPFDNAPSES